MKQPTLTRRRLLQHLLATGATAGGLAGLVRENSQVAFGADALKQTLRLVSGKVLAVFAQGEHRILTTTASIGIRGTAAYVEDVEPERTYFCLCYGETEVQTAGGQRAAGSGQRASYATTHHESPRYIYRDAGAAKPFVEAPMLNHTDAELIMLEGLVGRYPPFYGKEKSGAY